MESFIASATMSSVSATLATPVVPQRKFTNYAFLSFDGNETGNEAFTILNALQAALVEKVYLDRACVLSLAEVAREVRLSATMIVLRSDQTYQNDHQGYLNNKHCLAQLIAATKEKPQVKILRVNVIKDSGSSGPGSSPTENGNHAGEFEEGIVPTNFATDVQPYLRHKEDWDEIFSQTNSRTDDVIAALQALRDAKVVEYHCNASEETRKVELQSICSLVKLSAAEMLSNAIICRDLKDIARIIKGNHHDVTIKGLLSMALKTVAESCASDESNRLAFCQPDGCEALFKVLRQFGRKDKMIAVQTLEVVYRLALSSKCRAEMGRTGCLDAVSSTLLEFGGGLGDDTIELDLVGCTAVLNMTATANNLCSRTLGETNVGTALVRILAKYNTLFDRGDFSGLKTGLLAVGAISNLAAGNSDNKKQLGKAGACELVVHFLKSVIHRPSVEKFMVNTCSAIANLASDHIPIWRRKDFEHARQNGGHITGSGGPMNTIQGPSRSHECNGSRFAAVQACNLVIQAFAEHGTKNRRIAYYALRAIIVLAENSISRRTLEESNVACDAVCAILVTFKADVPVSSEGCRLVASLKDLSQAWLMHKDKVVNAVKGARENRNKHLAMCVLGID